MLVQPCNPRQPNEVRRVSKARLRAVPTILVGMARIEWWARHRTRSRPVALPTLRARSRTV